MSRAFFFAVLLGTAGPVLAQEYPRRDLNPQELAQNLLPVPTEDVDYAEVGEALYQLYLNPLDLNACTREDLAATYVLDERQLNAFFDYRQHLGPFLSVYELQAVPLLDLPTIYRLLPLVEVRGAGDRRLRADRQSFLLLRAERDLEQKRGYQPAEPNKNGTLPSRYQGDPFQLYTRLKVFDNRGLEGGFTLEKDPGEQLTFDRATRRLGADFISAHALLRDRGRWRAVALGDYQLQFGQGLVLAGGFFLGKGSETVLTARRAHVGIRPYTSAMEWGFLRGAAATYVVKSWEITPFVSRLRRDVNLDDDAENPTGSLQTSGLHRTPSELADRSQTAQQDAGLNVLWRGSGNRASIGLTLLHTSFDVTVQRADREYNRFEFSGKQNFVAGLQGGYRWRNANFFGEIARSQSGGVGLVAGALASLSRRFDASVVFRRYDRHFHSFHARSFAESSRPINETGLYLGWKYAPNPRWQVGGYVDAFRFPWLKYLVDRPSSGAGALLRVGYAPTKTTRAFAQFLVETKEKNVPDRLQKENEVLRTTRQNGMLGFDHAPTRKFSLSSRAFYSAFQFRGFRPSQGWGLVQDASVGFQKWSLTGRLAYFNTDDYDSRFYSYEQDVLYAFSLPAYFNHGFRQYLLAQCRLGPALDLWLRVSRSEFLNQSTVGSGLDLIEAPHRTEVKAQVRWRF